MNLRELALEHPTIGPGGTVSAPRSTAGETWARVWPDTLRRLIPFGAAALAYARLRTDGARRVGLAADHPARDLALGLAVGVPMAGVAAAFRAWAVPGYRLPTVPDQALQTLYYVGMNAPVEELFWRGMLQTEVIERAERRFGPGVRANIVGWFAATAGFGVFHSLGGDWNWRAVAGATAAGGVLGLTYALQREPRSIWPSVIVHGLTTCGFFNLGDLVLHARTTHTFGRLLSRTSRLAHPPAEA
jgi:membrane protease YdiL (CAAX protease family)